jgi:hypothetical protein
MRSDCARIAVTYVSFGRIADRCFTSASAHLLIPCFLAIRRSRCCIATVSRARSPARRRRSADKRLELGTRDRRLKAPPGLASRDSSVVRGSAVLRELSGHARIVLEFAVVNPCGVARPLGFLFPWVAPRACRTTHGLPLRGAAGGGSAGARCCGQDRARTNPVAQC